MGRQFCIGKEILFSQGSFSMEKEFLFCEGSSIMGKYFYYEKKVL